MRRISDGSSSSKEGTGSGLLRKPWLVFLTCMVLLGLMIALVFIRYRAKLEEVFYRIAIERLDSYTEAQAREVEAYLVSVDDNIQAVRLLAESSTMSLESGVFVRYLERINEENEFTATYITMDRLKADLERPDSRPGDRLVYDKLYAGETVLSEIRYSNRLDGYYFGYGVPVRRDGRVVGVVRCIVDASKLMETKQIMKQTSLIASYIVEGDGSLGYSRVLDAGKEAAIRGLVFEQLASEELKLSDRYSEALRQKTFTGVIGKERGVTVILSSMSLGYNDWHIVNVAEASGLLEHTRIIMKNTVVSSLILMAIVAVFGVIAYRVYDAQRKRLSFESERYQLLSEFSDTVLMQYYYETDTLELTANVRNRFDVDDLRKERYLEESAPLLKVMEEDWNVLRDFFLNPCSEDEIKYTRLRILDKTQNYLWCSLQIRFVYEDGRLVAAIGKITDISSQKELEEKLVRQAQMDELTGIYNKATAQRKIDGLMAERQSGYLFMIDIDNFKEINDTYGHAKGDEVLVGIGSILRDVFRREDVVGRIGGDEFVAYVCGEEGRNFSAPERARLILERLHRSQKDWGVAVTASIGIASCPGDGENYETLYMAADRAMYMAKQEGKDRFWEE